MCSRFCIAAGRLFPLNRVRAVKLPLKLSFIQTYRGVSATPVVNRKDFRSPIRFSKFRKIKTDYDIDDDGSNDSDDGDEGYKELDQIAENILYVHRDDHQLLVIQPFIKWGPKKNTLTTPELQLDEAVTLVKTLREWKVVDKMLIGVMDLNKVHIFGPGQLAMLKDRIVSNSTISAVFISVNMLKPAQQEVLVKELGVPVYDRYTIVIHIFRNHATTKEAKLQIKLAELPYLWSRLSRLDKGYLTNFGGVGTTLGTEWKGKEFHMFLLKQRQARIKSEIEKLRQHRILIRKNRLKNEIPVVAVVGYTNCGKTSLIKALTGRKKLIPENYLFATLDITVHEGILPSSLRVLFVDTIGFISDIPTTLFESFIATLEDVKLADVIIHVRDISHPDTIAQDKSVADTLNLLEMPKDLLDGMITVGNKIDLLEEDDLKKFSNSNMILISASKMMGTDTLLKRVEEKILEVTNRKVIFIKAKTGSAEYEWLLENVTVIQEVPTPNDSQYMLMKVIITDTEFAKFKHIFIGTSKNKGES